MDNKENSNSEYEMILGKPTRMSIFADDEESYKAFRQSIIDAPIEKYNPKGKLPFDGIKLDSYANYLLKHQNTDVKEEESFSPMVNEEPVITTEKVPKWKKNFMWLLDHLVISKHIFSIVKPDVCNAKGYYDENEDVFVIVADSRFQRDLYSNYVSSSLIEKRNKFIMESCEVNQGFCRVKEDTKVSSATLAASYVLGLKVWYSRWLDEEGKTLKDIYPNKYGSNIILTIHFYLNKEMDYGSCNAEAIYDGETKSFKVLKGAIFTLRPALSYGFTAGEYQRTVFLKKFCLLKNKKYILKEDHVFDSPNLAATFLQGEEAIGDEWKDENGKSIKEYNINV